MKYAFQMASRDMICTKCHEDWIGVQPILRFCCRNLRGRNVATTDGRDLLITSLRWDQVP
jgi:hypothetical protein